MPTPPQLNLLVQIPSPDGGGLLLEDLRNGRQQLFVSSEPLLAALAESIGAVTPPKPSTNPSPDRESASAALEELEEPSPLTVETVDKLRRAFGGDG